MPIDTATLMEEAKAFQDVDFKQFKSLLLYFLSEINGSGGLGGGDMLSTNNLSDLASVETALNNLGIYRCDDDATYANLKAFTSPTVAVAFALIDNSAEGFRIAFWRPAATNAEDSVWKRPDDYATAGVWELVL